MTGLARGEREVLLEYVDDLEWSPGNAAMSS